MKATCPECAYPVDLRREDCPHCDHSPEQTFLSHAAVVFLPAILAFLFLPLWILNHTETIKGTASKAHQAIAMPASAVGTYANDSAFMWLLLLSGMVPLIFLGIAIWFSEE